MPRTDTAATEPAAGAADLLTALLKAIAADPEGGAWSGWANDLLNSDSAVRRRPPRNEIAAGRAPTLTPRH